MYEFYQYLHMWEMVPNRTVYCSIVLIAEIGDAQNAHQEDGVSMLWCSHILKSQVVTVWSHLYEDPERATLIYSGICKSHQWLRLVWGHWQERGIGNLLETCIYRGVGSGACISQTHQTVPQQSLHSSVHELYFYYNKTQFLKTKIKQKQTNLCIKLVA